MFKKGDKVLAIDEDISGTIINISNSIITVLLEDGFEMQFSEAELVHDRAPITPDTLNNYSISEVIQSKEEPRKTRTARKKPKDRFQPIMEVDLHIHQLTNSEKHMTKHDILTLQVETAERQLNFAIRKRIQKVVFIHGLGEGVLKLELEYLFGRYDNVKFYDADYQKYGTGATEVYIYQNIKLK